MNYYESVMAAMGTAGTDDFFRLFMAPGMDHCFGGEGPNSIDALQVLEHWVEEDKAPDFIIASHVRDGKVDRTLCVYPKVARYIGHGSTDQADNFSCLPPN